MDIWTEAGLTIGTLLDVTIRVSDELEPNRQIQRWTSGRHSLKADALVVAKSVAGQYEPCSKALQYIRDAMVRSALWYSRILQILC